MAIILKVREAMISNPITVTPNALIYEAAKTMRDKEIGSVIIVDKGKVLGIATERDLVRRVLAENKDPKVLPISAIMSKPVISISPDEDLVDAAQLMKEKGIKRLIIMDGDKLLGIMTTSELTNYMKRAVEELATTLYLIDRKSEERHTSR